MNSKIYLGWDIGGANTKISVLDTNLNVIDVHFKNLAIWNNFSELNNYFKSISGLYSSYNIENFITITAESCDNFKSRDEGIFLILNNCNNYIKGNKYYYSNSNLYLKYSDAIKSPKSLYSTNWILTANLLKSLDKINLMIDIGSTTTDFIYKNINIEDNNSDYKRLSNNTLLYTGVVRTPLSMIFNDVIFSSKKISLINELFSSTGDIFNITKDIDFSSLDYTGADNKDFSLNNSLARLSRSIGLDYNKDNYKDLVALSKFIKKEIINIVFRNINLLFNNNLNNICLSSIGEGAFLIKELAKTHKIKYISIEDEKIFSIINLDHAIVYKNLTSALVVTNFFKK